MRVDVGGKGYRWWRGRAGVSRDAGVREGSGELCGT